jgi:hypothetical protein
MVIISPLRMMGTIWRLRRFCHVAAQTADQGLVFRARMLHENAALAVDSPPGYAKSSIDWYSFAQ